MPSLDQLTASPTPIKVGDKEYRFSPLTINQWGELQKWIYTQLPDPIALARRAVEGMPPEFQAELLREAYHEAKDQRRDYQVGSTEADSLLKTPGGGMEILRLSLAKHHPDVTIEEMQELMNALPSEAETAEQVAAVAFESGPINPESRSGPKGEAEAAAATS